MLDVSEAVKGHRARNRRIIREFEREADDSEVFNLECVTGI